MKAQSLGCSKIQLWKDGWFSMLLPFLTAVRQSGWVWWPLEVPPRVVLYHWVKHNPRQTGFFLWKQHLYCTPSFGRLQTCSWVMEGYEGTAELVGDPGDWALAWKGAFREVLDELHRRPCRTWDCTGKSQFNNLFPRTSFFISTHSEIIQGVMKMPYLQLDKLHPDLIYSSWSPGQKSYCNVHQRLLPASTATHAKAQCWEGVSLWQAPAPWPEN